MFPESLRKENNEELVKEVLSQDLKKRYGNHEFKFFEPQILKTHLRKTIIGYTIEYGKSHKTYIGIHRESDDERFGYVFRVLQFLRSHGFNESGELRVPRPIIFIPSLYLIIMDEAEGNLLSKEIKEQRVDVRSFIEGSAKWLVKLHNFGNGIPFNARKNTEPNSYRGGICYENREKEAAIQTSIKYKETLLKIFPTLAEKIEVISKRLVAIHRKEILENNISNYIGKVSLVHGDYHAKNIYVSLDSVTVIDFEESRFGAPAFDLGYFAAQLKMSFGFSPRIAKLLDVFVCKYLEKSRLLLQPPCYYDEARMEKQMKLYEAQTYLQRSYHTYWLLKLKPDTQLVARWMEETRSCLEEAEDLNGK